MKNLLEELVYVPDVNIYDQKMDVIHKGAVLMLGPVNHHFIHFN